MGQPGVVFTGMVNWVRRNNRAVNSAIFILYIRRGRGGKKKPWFPIPLGGKELDLSRWLMVLWGLSCRAKADLILCSSQMSG